VQNEQEIEHNDNQVGLVRVNMYLKVGDVSLFEDII
jgi:hypothetical protein